ncbi:L,D-transpeptidase [Bacillus shivajii]|uniref:L,D-transpeptidase n=1 Tax=Bacillus shivajii TaxID=1983719 RepID=UPI001CFA525A|nr:L,D-transpeptidase [Bacillus shivajii]UCZ54634.1 L,D-transpeptidase [Bacillus shivajii]
MLTILLSFLLVISPVWPLGENPVVGDPYLIVKKSTNELAFIIDGEVKQTFRVATGQKEAQTPEGEFTVTVKAINPYYRKTDIQGGDEKNPLGTRWIGFDADDTDGRTYGIHGTNRPSSIGYYVTQGCVRMKNEDVEILFEEVPLGTKVFITEREDSFEVLGKEMGAIKKE